MRDSVLDDPAIASAPQEDGVVACIVYADGRKVAETSIDQLADWLNKPNHVVWVGLFEPSGEVLSRLQRQLGLHPLAVLDAGRTHNHPKLEQYDEAAFIVARTAQIVDDRIALGETQIFVGRGFVVSIRYGASIPYAEVRKRCEACPELLGHGADYIVYSILEFIVANYDPVIEKVRTGVSEIEDQVLKRELPHEQIERLYRLRRNLLKLRDAITPLLDVCRRLESSDVVAIDPEMQMRFRQTTHHVDRTRDDIDSLREVLSFAFEVSLMMGQSRQTHVQSQQTVIARQLAAWAAILAVPTAIAGIYGMNFKNMPELEWRYGYFLVLAVIFLSCAGLYGWFRRNDWL